MRRKRSVTHSAASQPRPARRTRASGSAGAKLAQSLGRALRKAYAGELELPPTTANTENLVRVRWMRE